MEVEEKIRENRLRRMARRQGLELIKSRTRDPRAVDYGSYTLIDLAAHVGGPGPLYLDDIERILIEEAVQ